MKSVVQERGQITVPKALRRALALRKGTELEIEPVPGGFIARKRAQRSAWREVVGILGKPGSTDKLIDEMRGPVDHVDP